MLVTDAPAIEIRKNRGGGIVSLDYVDGSTFKVLIDNDGRRPLPPAPAYEQVIHGRPWVLAEEGGSTPRPRQAVIRRADHLHAEEPRAPTTTGIRRSSRSSYDQYRDPPAGDAAGTLHSSRICRPAW